MRAMIDKAIQRFSAVFALTFLLGASGIAWAQSALPTLFDVAASKGSDRQESAVCKFSPGEFTTAAPVQPSCMVAVN